MVGASFGAVGFAGTDDVDDFGLDVSGGSPMFEVLQPSRSARVEFVERFLAQVVMELLANVQATPASGPLARKCVPLTPSPPPVLGACSRVLHL
jgi:hypothetical protein